MGLQLFRERGLEKMRQVVFPITCPECRGESVGRLSAATVSLVLRSGEPLELTSPCHGSEWQASTCEMEQIREYLWAAQFAQ
jgi:hypothetical protein